MIVLRSVLLLLVMAVVTPPYALVALLAAPLMSPRARLRFVGGWRAFITWVVWHLCGIRWRVIGREHLPDRPAVVLAKHQSAWETIAFQCVFPLHIFVFKRELHRVPFFGWALAIQPMISIDRSAGKDALAQVLEQGSRRLEQGFWVVVFPEGTRIAVGTTRRYKAGGAYLAAHTGAPVVPVAHNAGEFWRRKAFLKYPGVVTVSIGPVIETAGLTPEEINTRARTWIEAEMRRLFPHHYGSADSASAAVDTAAEEGGNV